MTKNEIIKKYESLNQVHYHNKNDRDLVEQMMQEYADQQLILSGVSQQRELLIADMIKMIKSYTDEEVNLVCRQRNEMYGSNL